MNEPKEILASLAERLEARKPQADAGSNVIKFDEQRQRVHDGYMKAIDSIMECLNADCQRVKDTADAMQKAMAERAVDMRERIVKFLEAGKATNTRCEEMQQTLDKVKGGN